MKRSSVQNQRNSLKVKVALDGTDEITDLLPKGRKKNDLFKKQRGQGGSQLLGHSWIFDKDQKKKSFKKWL